MYVMTLHCYSYSSADPDASLWLGLRFRRKVGMWIRRTQQAPLVWRSNMENGMVSKLTMLDRIM